MRAVFSFIGLLLVVAVIGMAAKKQLQALGFGQGVAAAASGPGTASTRSPTQGAITGYEAADPGGGVAPAPAQAIERARVDVKRAVEQGAANRAPD